MRNMGGATLMLSNLLSRSREQLGYFWRALAPIPIAYLVVSIKGGSTATGYLLSIVLLAFLARFSVGNYNYAAAVFSDGAAWIKEGNPVTQVRRRFAFDATLFGLQLLALTWLGLTVQSPIWFCRGLVVLLLADLLFPLYDRFAWPQWILWLLEIRDADHKKETPISLIRRWPEHYAPRTWMTNNACAAVALICFDVLAQRHGLQAHGIKEADMYGFAVFGVGLVNSIIDVVLTRLHFD